jgi:hypothetical protein
MAGAGRGTGRWPAGKILAAVQIALSLVLLVAAGLFLRTLLNLGAVSLGYDPAPIVMFRVNPASAGYTAESARPFYDELLTKLATIHAIERVSFSENGLFYGNDISDGVSFPTHQIPAGVNPDVRRSRRTGLLRDHRHWCDGAMCRRAIWPRALLNETMARRFSVPPARRRAEPVVHYSFGDGECEIQGGRRRGLATCATKCRHAYAVFPH